jgi:hypothetical protein
MMSLEPNPHKTAQQTVKQQLPDQQQRYLFWGTVTQPKPGECRIIVIFDGTSITSAVSFRYSSLWGLVVTNTLEDIQLGIYRRMRDRFRRDEARLNRCVDFANCPPLSISFEDWTQSAADTIQRIISQWGGIQGGNHPVVVLSSHVHWARENRMTQIYEKLRLKSVERPGSYLLSEILDKGKKRIEGGQVKEQAAVDANYHILVAKKGASGLHVAQQCICPERTPLDITGHGKNQGPPIIVKPFLENSGRCDVILFKEKGNHYVFVSANRVKTDKKQLELTARFEPLAETPILHAADEKDITIIKNVNAIPDIKIEMDQPPLQIAVLIDATMPENQVEPLKEKLIATARAINTANPSARFGLAVYGDYPLDKDDIVEYQVRKDIPHQFLPFSGWQKLCEDKIKRMTPRDFMSALDQGLIHIQFFPWKADARKHLVLIFSSPPHPVCDPEDRPVRTLPFPKAQENWEPLIMKLKQEFGIDVMVVYLREKVSLDEIYREIDYVCTQMRQFDFKGEGIDKLDQVESTVLKSISARYRLEPDTFHIPCLAEDLQ